MKSILEAGMDNNKSPNGIMLRALYERETEISELRRLVITDGLTGVTNRRGFDQAIDMALERRHRRSTDHTQGTISMLICDIDHFKAVNDTYGHPVGDEVLKRVAKILQKHCRITDTLARYGGEEFALIFENCTRQDAMRIANEIRLDIIEVFSDGKPCTLTASFGVATLMQQEDTLSYVNHADKALYAAKHGEGLDGLGRNIVYCSTEIGGFEYIDRVTGDTMPIIQAQSSENAQLDNIVTGNALPIAGKSFRTSRLSL